MGACISKCRPKKSHQPKLEEDQDHDHQQDRISHVQDKLVIISQTPKNATQIPLVINPNKLIISPSRTPPSPSASTSSSSVSSFVTCTTSKSSISSSTSISSSSSSSSSASSLISKDKSSFSNEFLWSCYKENPHISRINSLKETSHKYYISNNKNNITSTKPAIVSKTAKQACPQKRMRSISPSANTTSTLTRQKSYRLDDHHHHHHHQHHHHQPDQQYSRDYYYNKCSTLRSSPSPSRRFANNGDNECHSKRTTTSSSVGSTYSPSLFSRKENLRPCLRSSTSTREQRNVHRISSKIDEIAVAEALACHEIDSVLMEDIDNPLISLDCFIFI